MELTKWQEEEWLRCATSFEYFAANYIEIRSLSEGSVKFKLYDYQRRVLKEFQDNRFNVIRKFRQGGLTTLAVLWALWICTFKENQQILVMSKTDLEAIKSGKIAKRALDVLKQNHPWLMPRLGSDSKHVLSFIDTKSEIEFGSTARARGQALNYVIVDEAAFIKNMEDIWADMYPTISSGGNVIVISTVNGVGNWYHQLFTDAQAKRNGFNVINIHYTEHPAYCDPKWVRETRANLGEKKFAQEVEGSFLGSGDTFLNKTVLSRLDQQVRDKFVIKKLFKEWDCENLLLDVHKDNDDPNLHSWDRGALWIWDNPQENKEYIMGVDAADGIGEAGDYSAFVVFDMYTLEQVAEFYSNTIPADTYAKIVARVGIHYNTALVVVDNFGPGGVVLNKLENDIYYENIYYQLTRTQERGGLTINRTTRPQMLEALQNHTQNDTIKIKSQRIVDELNTFIYDASRKRAEAQRNKHDDLVMALAMMLYVRDKQIRDTAFAIDPTTNIHNPVSHREYEQIKKEIEGNSWDDIMNNDETEDYSNLIPGIMFPTGRPNHTLLREFGL